MSDAMPEGIEVIDEWSVHTEHFRLIQRKAGPMELQIRVHQDWEREKEQYVHGVLCGRISQLSKKK